MLERYSKDLFNGILQAPNYLKCQLVGQGKQICSCLATVEHGGQKNRNGKTTAVSFLAMFSTGVSVLCNVLFSMALDSCVNVSCCLDLCQKSSTILWHLNNDLS